jgi:hypothetical protein
MPFQRIGSKVVYRATKVNNTSRSVTEQESSGRSPLAETRLNSPHSSRKEGSELESPSFYSVSPSPSVAASPCKTANNDSKDAGRSEFGSSQHPSRQHELFRKFAAMSMSSKRVTEKYRSTTPVPRRTVNNNSSPMKSNTKAAKNNVPKRRHSKIKDQQKGKRRDKTDAKIAKCPTTVQGVVAPNEEINLRVKLRRGGYVMAGFSIAHRTFSPGDVEYMKLCARALENVFTRS